MLRVLFKLLFNILVDHFVFEYVIQISMAKVILSGSLIRIVGTWGVVQKSFLDVADVVYVAFLMHSPDMIPCAPRVGSDNPLIFWTEHLFWYLGFSGFVYVVQGGIFCYNHPRPIVCAVNAPGNSHPRCIPETGVPLF